MAVKGFSLFGKILSAFLLIIVTTVCLITAVEYYSTRSELPLLLTEVRTGHAAAVLSSLYTREKSWDSLDGADNPLRDLEMTNPADKLVLRYIVRDREGKTLYNSFTNITEIDKSPLLEGETAELLDYTTQKKTGTVTVYIGSDYVRREAVEYLLSLLRARIFQGLVIIAAAFLVSAILSGLILRPVRALTDAAEKMSRQEISRPVPDGSGDELGRMARAFNGMMTSLEKQKELRKILIRNISHDISTPLNVIRLEARGLADGLTGPGEASGHIIEEVDNLKDLILDLDWLAETDSGEYRLNKTFYSPADLIVQEAERWQLRAQAEGITLHPPFIADNLPEIEADSLRVAQALGNLIDNSMKYTGEGGEIFLSVRREKGFLRIVVEDNGSGIADEDLPFLFERFYRASNPATRGRPGRGLGLAIVRQIAGLHGGTAGAEQLPGGGSRFFFTLALPTVS